ncbi:hypothetical protein E2C01_027642 [Portunus trituberculatus]|uniref:Uncharacterized protein n=1 Tax=Portunus trituberculatus TaxID=210409 RepID=A0A5B7EM65_PORTR|nr:hypothetical protein [Portunus trituberculatus]
MTRNLCECTHEAHLPAALKCEGQSAVTGWKGERDVTSLTTIRPQRCHCYSYRIRLLPLKYRHGNSNKYLSHKSLCIHE